MTHFQLQEEGNRGKGNDFFKNTVKVITNWVSNASTVVLKAFMSFLGCVGTSDSHTFEMLSLSCLVCIRISDPKKHCGSVTPYHLLQLSLDVRKHWFLLLYIALQEFGYCQKSFSLKWIFILYSSSDSFTSLTVVIR